jgi:hypothetical protein
MAKVPFPMPRSYTPGTATSQGKKSRSLVFRKPNYFEARLLFLRQWKVYVLPQVQTQKSTAARAAVIFPQLDWSQALGIKTLSVKPNQ